MSGPVDKLRALGETRVPPSLAEDLARLGAFPEAPRRRFWEALGPSLAEPVTLEAERRLDAFTREHVVPAEDLARAIKAARFLVREAARRNLTLSEFEVDLRALLDSPELVAILSAGYEQARAIVRDEAIVRALADHGRVASTVAWRVDTLDASSRGELAGARFGVLTMVIEGGGKSETVTVQLPADVVRELGAFATAIDRKP